MLDRWSFVLVPADRVAQQKIGGLKGGGATYREVVSSDCNHPATAEFYAETELDFNFWSIPQKEPVVAIANYQLSKGRPRKGDLILVDEGTLVVAKTGTGQRPVRVTTTKRIEFDWPFSSQVLAVMMCASGYGELAGDLFCCAASKAAAEGKKIPAFPGEPPPQNAGAAAPRASRRSPVEPTTTRAVAGADSAAAAAASNLVDCGAKFWARALRDCAHAIERTAD